MTPPAEPWCWAEQRLSTCSSAQDRPGQYSLASLSGTLQPTARLTGIISTFVNNKHLPPLLMAKMKTGCAILVACALVVGTSLVRLNVLYTNTLEVTLLEFRQTVRNSALVFVRFMRSGASSVYFVFLEMQNCFRSTSVTVDFFHWNNIQTSKSVCAEHLSSIRKLQWLAAALLTHIAEDATMPVVCLRVIVLLCPYWRNMQINCIHINIHVMGYS